MRRWLPVALLSTVQIANFRFEPQTLEISAGAGVTWRNADEEIHAIVAADGSFASPASFAAAPAGRTYQVWLRHGSVWTSLGTAEPDATGRARLIADDPACATAPDALAVTLEPAEGSAAPTGPVVVRWPAGSDPVAHPAHE